MNKPTVSIVITLYKSAKNLPSLIEELNTFSGRCEKYFLIEVVFVDDGCPQGSYVALNQILVKGVSFPWIAIELSKNFGAPVASRTGLSKANGDFYTIYASDLQEPFDFLIDAFIEIQKFDADIVFGQRAARKDPVVSKFFSKIFWSLYHSLIDQRIPQGGADLFICKKIVRDAALQYRDVSVFLIGILFEVGFVKRFIPYTRAERKIGKSSWTLKKKLGYVMNSIFSMSPTPIKLLLVLGLVGTATSAVLASLMIIAKINGTVEVPGFAATVVTVSFFGAINSLGLGIIGEYIWRIYENTRAKPISLIRRTESSN